MSRRNAWRCLFSLCIALIAGIVLTPRDAWAAKPISGNTVTIGKAQTINDDVYVTGQKVVVDGRINGNLIAAAGVVRVNGTVTGSVIAATGSMTVRGHIGHDLTTAAGKATIERGGRVGRDVMAAIGSIVIAGTVARNAQLAGGSIRLDPGAHVGGNLKYWGNENAKIPAGTVDGQIQHQQGRMGWNDQFPLGVFSVIVWIRTLIGLLALGLLLVWLAPAFGRQSAETVSARPFGSFGWGLLSIIVIPIVAALILFVGFFIGGWWLGLMALAIYWIALAVSVTMAGLFIGLWLLRRTGQPPRLWLALLIGVVLLMLASIVPILGGIVVAIAVVTAFGALLLTAIRRSRRSREEVPLEAVAVPN